MAFFPFCWMQLPREGCAKIRRREARCINMFPPGSVDVNRNEYETTTFRNKNHRVSRCVASHKRYSCPRNRFRHLLRNPSWRNPRPSRSQRQRQDHPSPPNERNFTSHRGASPRPGALDRRLGPYPPPPRHRLCDSGCRPFPPFHRRRKCRPHPHFGKLGRLPHCRPRPGNAPARRSRSPRLRPSPPPRTLRRAAPARRRRARPRRRSSHPAYGRTLRRARSRHPRRAPARIQRPRPPSRQDHRVRHPRSPRSIASRFPHRPARSRPHRCQRHSTGVPSPRPPRSSRLHFLSRDDPRSLRMSPQMTTWSFFADHRAEILGATLDHLVLVVIAMIIAILIGVPLGMFIVQRPALRAIALGIASVFQTIPSLALFGFLIPIPFIGGIGKRTAVVALVLYALLPILRNTYVGLTGIDPAVLESAEAMGMTRAQILFRVRFPLALAVILAGIRTATIITIGVATIAAAIGAGGLGTFIFRGVALSSEALILAGAIPAALLALLADFLLGLLERRLKVI